MSEENKKSIMKSGRDYIRTEGGDINFNNPELSEVSILTIARHLSLSPRYNGCMYSLAENGEIVNYTVGQHSLLVAHVLPPSLKLAGLLHDASEAFLGDILSPIKNFLPDYKVKEKNFEDVIMKRFNISEETGRHALIHQADKEVMAAEMMFLGWKDIADYPAAPVDVSPVSSQNIFKKFIRTLFELSQLKENQEDQLTVIDGIKIPTLKLVNFWINEYEKLAQTRSHFARVASEERFGENYTQKYGGEGSLLFDAEKEIEKKTHDIQVAGLLLDCIYDFKNITKEKILSIKDICLERPLGVPDKKFVDTFFDKIKTPNPTFKVKM